MKARAMTAVPMRMRSYGGLSDQDRIFTNVYKDQDPFIEGALKRVRIIVLMQIGRLA